jgi:hypothetical protein
MVLFASENDEVHMLNSSVHFWVEELDIRLEQHMDACVSSSTWMPVSRAARACIDEKTTML